MLYELWRRVVRACRERIALRDIASGCAWTFAELEARTENKAAADEPVAFPQSPSAEFIFGVLRAWRNNQVVCPLEPGASPWASPIRWERECRSLPSGIAHLKTTSATSGPPRLVAFTAPQLIADAENIVATMGLQEEWPNLGVISLAH